MPVGLVQHILEVGAVNKCKFSVIIKSWVCMVGQLVGLCHAVQGGLDWFRLDVLRISKAKLTFSNWLSESAEYFVLGTSGKVFKEVVWSDSNWLEIFLVSFLRANLLDNSSFNHCSPCGWLRSSEVNQEVIPVRRGCMVKPNGACSGTYVERRWDNWSIGKWKSRDKESETVLNSPGNHSLYKQLFVSISRWARCLAVVSWTTSSALSTKLDFCSHPAAVVLSVWHNKHDSGPMLLPIESTHKVMAHSRNSKKFSDVHKGQSTGISKL